MLKRSILAVAIASAAAGAVAQDTINADYPGFDSGSPANQFQTFESKCSSKAAPHPGTGGSGDHGSRLMAVMFLQGRNPTQVPAIPVTMVQLMAIMFLQGRNPTQVPAIPVTMVQLTRR